MKNKYLSLVEKYTPKENRLLNSVIVFISGGLLGLLSELLSNGYKLWFNIPSKESGVLVILSLIILSSILTALGIFDVLVTKLKCALIIPITGFAHSRLRLSNALFTEQT